LLNGPSNTGVSTAYLQLALEPIPAWAFDDDDGG
jgi:hypothetical protein